jgi:hypothetical protein
VFSPSLAAVLECGARDGREESVGTHESGPITVDATSAESSGTSVKNGTTVLSTREHTQRPSARRLARWGLVLVACLGVLGEPARAQSLPDGIVESQTISPEQQAAIQKFVDQHRVPFTGADNGQVAKARKSLMRPVENEKASVDFRFKYGDALAPLIAQVAKGKSEQSVVNSLLLTASIATDQSSRVLEESLAAKNSAIRYAAVSGLKRVLTIVARGRGAVTPDRAAAIVLMLARVVENEGTREIADAALQGLEAGLELSAGLFKDVRPLALRALGNAGAKRMAGMPGPASLQDSCAGLAHAGAAIRQVLTLPGVQPALAEDAKEASARFGDEMLRLVLRHVQGGALAKEGVPPEELKKERLAAANLVRLAQGVTILSLALPMPAEDPAAHLEKGKPESDATAIRLIEEFLKR